MEGVELQALEVVLMELAIAPVGQEIKIRKRRRVERGKENSTGTFWEYLETRVKEEEVAVAVAVQTGQHTGHSMGTNHSTIHLKIPAVWASYFPVLMLMEEYMEVAETVVEETCPPTNQAVAIDPNTIH